MKIRFKKLAPNAVIPTKAHNTDAGFDLTATSIDYKNDVVTYGTGISVEIPEGYVGKVYPRSSIFRKDLILSNSVGIIDSGYRGEILVKFRDTKVKFPSISYCITNSNGNKEIVTKTPNLYRQHYSVGSRIAQLIIEKLVDVEFEEAEELSDSERGTGGYGSTGERTIL